MQTLEVIKEGSKGIAVIKWQQFLIGQGYTIGSADGLFDEEVADATADFQLKNNLIPNGIVGNLTYAAAVNYGFVIALEIASFQGISLNATDGLIEWDKVAANPNLTIGFTYLKATEGTKIIDSSYEANKKYALQNGLLVGSTHVFKTDESGSEQAKHLLNTINNIEEGILAPSLYFAPATLDKNNVQTVIAELHAFIDEVTNTLGISPIIYTNYNSWVNLLGNPIEFNEYKLWIGEYAPSFPKMFGGWTEWALWQYTNTGFVTGIPHTHVAITKYNINSRLI